MMRRAVVFTFVFLYGIAFLPGSLFEKVSHAEQAAGFESTWAAFKTALEKDDKEAVAGMIQFPIEYTLPQFMAKDKAEFLSKYSGIFPPAARQAILKAKPSFIAEEKIYSVKYCVKAGECYMMTFKQAQAGAPYKMISLGAFGE